MAELTGFLRAPLGNLAFSRSQSQVMSETEIVFQSFRLWSLCTQRKINLVASPFLLVHSHIFASGSVTPCLFFHGLSFSFLWFPRFFSELICISPICPLMTALRMGGSWPVLTNTHSELTWLSYYLFFQSCLHLHCKYFAVVHATGFKCSHLLPQAACYRLQEDFVSCMVLSKKQSEQKRHGI